MIETHVLADQVRTLYRQTLVVLTANCINTVIVSALLWGNRSRTLLLGWVGLVFAVTGARLWLLRSYRRASPEAADAATWGRRFAWGSAASGLLWGGASAALLEGSDSYAQLLIIFFVGGMCAAATGSLASYFPAFVVFVCPALLALSWSVAKLGGALHQAMAGVLLLYGAGLFAIARINRRALMEVFTLRFENSELLKALTQSQRHLEESNRTLELRVAERGEALRQQSEALREAQRLETVGRFAGGVAHDFNNLLTVLLANISALAADRRLDAEARSSLREMREAALRGADLVRQLLMFSRRQRTSPETLDLNSAVTGMQGWLGRVLGETLTLKIVLDKDPVFVHVDPTQMEQVIVNLISNARDATTGGGVVTIQTETVELREDADDLPKGRYAVLSVADTGAGMDSETRKRIFEPFFTTKEVGKGTGLGLATAYGIVEQGGGHIRVSSEPTRGSCFRVYLPLAAAPEPAKTRVPASSGMREIPRAKHEFTILLVEDEDTIRNVTQRILTKAGYHVLTAGSAEAALKISAAHSAPLELLVTDVVMAGIDGPALAARLAPLRPEMRTLFISGYSRDHALPADNPAGGVGFLAKPFTYDALITKVTALLAAPPATATRARDPAAGT